MTGCIVMSGNMADINSFWPNDAIRQQVTDKIRSDKIRYNLFKVGYNQQITVAT